MKKEFLDKMYSRKHEAETALYAQKRINDFPSNEEAAAHRRFVQLLDNTVALTDSVIRDYLELHGASHD